MLSHSLKAPPDAEECSAYGDRTEIRQIWAQEVTAESVGLYAATQVFAIQRQVLPLSPTVAESTERCYAISSVPRLPDQKANAIELLQGFRGHWSVESKNHYRRDVTYLEDRSPVKHHNAARVLASMKMLAIFLCQIDAHAPRCERERSLPEFNRSCAINGIDRALNWFKRKHNPLAR